MIIAREPRHQEAHSAVRQVQLEFVQVVVMMGTVVQEVEIVLEEHVYLKDLGVQRN